MDLAGRDLVAIGDLADDELEALLDTARSFQDDPLGARGRLDGRIVCTAFFEPSTRTRLSFESATHRLGGAVIGFSDAGATSTKKGETLEDTIRVLAGYADLVVVRSPQAGAVRRAAGIVDVPVVNAGDGAGEHPTQTLVDLFTMQRHFGSLRGRRVALVGDLKYGRTVHSLVPALERFDAVPVAVPAPGLGLPDGLGEGVPTTDLESAAATCDVLYVTRVQQERFHDAMAYEAARDAFRVDAELLERMSSKAIVMHPLPRVGEVAADVDPLPSAKYFEQARNGVPVRMAILAHLLGEAP